MSQEECVCAKCHQDYSLRDECEPSKYCDRCVHDVVSDLETKLAATEIRAHESRALLQRLVRCVLEDKATTAGTTHLARLAELVSDYLQRTHNPRSILRGTANEEPWCSQCGHAETDHPRGGRCGAATEEGCDCPRFVAEAAPQGASYPGYCKLTGYVFPCGCSVCDALSAKEA